MERGEQRLEAIGAMDDHGRAAGPRHARHEAKPAIEAVLGHRVGRGLQLVPRRPVAPLGKVGRIGDREIEARIRQALLHGLRRRLHDVDGHDPHAGPKAIAFDVAI